MYRRIAQRGIGLAAAVLCASQALAQNWATLGTSENGAVWSIDKDSIVSGRDGLVYFTDQNSSNGQTETADEAVDCARRLQYTLKINDDFMQGWRDVPNHIVADSAMDAVLKYVCANAG
jgi:hypothetical protein